MNISLARELLEGHALRESRMDDFDDSRQPPRSHRLIDRSRTERVGDDFRERLVQREGGQRTGDGLAIQAECCPREGGVLLGDQRCRGTTGGREILQKCLK